MRRPTRTVSDALCMKRHRRRRKLWMASIIESHKAETRPVMDSSVPSREAGLWFLKEVSLWIRMRGDSSRPQRRWQFSTLSGSSRHGVVVIIFSRSCGGLIKMRHFTITWLNFAFPNIPFTGENSRNPEFVSVVLGLISLRRNISDLNFSSSPVE